MPEQLPVAGIKVYADIDQVHGPLNGAFNELLEHRDAENYKKRNSLEVEDIVHLQMKLKEGIKQNYTRQLDFLKNLNDGTSASKNSQASAEAVPSIGRI